MDLEIKKYDWKQYQSDMTPLLNVIILLYCSFSLIIGVIQLVLSVEKTTLIITNLLLGLIFLFVHIFRKRIHVVVKAILLSIVGLYSILTSIVDNGLLSTGITTLIGLVILLVIFFHTRVTIFFTLLSIIALMIWARLIQLGYISYDSEVLNRLNSFEQWIPNISTLAAIFIILIFSIDLLKKKMMRNIKRLEESNTELVKRDRYLEEYAYYDTLTSLPNLRKFKEVITEREEKGLLGQGYLVRTNIKHFKVLNSLLGMEQADEVLRELGKTIQIFTRSSSYVARLNGDEFIFWVKVDSDQRLIQSIHKFRERVESYIFKVINNFNIDCYIAVIPYRKGLYSIDKAISNLGIALKVAKERSFEDIIFFKDYMVKEVAREMILLDIITQAMDDDLFYMSYQEKVNITTNSTYGVEALVRLTLDDGTIISPGEFIPIIVKHHLMNRFTHMVIDKIFNEISSIKEKYGESIYLSINISPLVFLSRGFVESIRSRVDNPHIDPHYIIFEITEDVFIEDTDRVNSIISELKTVGIGISLDDFGKGFSSLSYISSIDLTELKIDKSFIDNITIDEKQFNIVNSITNIAKTLNIKVVAEGVETHEQLEKLKQTDCDLIQGYLFSKPEPLNPR